MRGFATRLPLLAAMWTMVIAASGQSTDAPHGPGLETVLDAPAMNRDLDELERIMREEWMFPKMMHADGAAAIRNLRGKGRMTVAEFALELQRVLAMSSDGHALCGSLYPALKQISKRELPFTLEKVGDRLVAIDPSSSRRNQLWNPQLPYVVAIDSVPIERWVEEAATLWPRSHTLALEARAANLVRFAGYLRTRLGIEDRPTFAVTLQSLKGEPTLLTVDDSGTFRESLFKYNLFLHRQEGWRIVAPNLGYIRLKGAPDKMAERIAEAMPKLRSTRGLVLDLRGNEGGGGSEIINLLGNWFAGGSHARHVAGFERYRNGMPPSSNSLAVSEDSMELSSEARSIVTAALKDFRERMAALMPFATSDRCLLLAPPSVEPRMRLYSSPWYLRTVPPKSVFYYHQPVVVLMDRHCFSSAEMIAAALQGLPNVITAGERTRGGSGSPGRFRLPASGLDVSLASKVAYVPPGGEPLEGRGMTPDVTIELDMSTVTGPADSMLDRAFQELETLLQGR